MILDTEHFADLKAQHFMIDEFIRYADAGWPMVVPPWLWRLMQEQRAESA